MNLLLHGVEDFKIVREDTLRNPAFYTGNHLAQFDCVVANPRFSLKNWGEVEWASDRWGRNQLGGVPPKGYADWAWVQHMLTSADPKTGRVAVVLPQGALFRQGSEARIRTHVLKDDRIEAVIGLAPNLFYGTGLAACVLTSAPGQSISSAITSIVECAGASRGEDSFPRSRQPRLTSGLLGLAGERSRTRISPPLLVSVPSESRVELGPDQPVPCFPHHVFTE